MAISENAKKTIEDKGLKVAEIEKLVADAQGSKDMITNGTKFIAKKVIGDMTVYADFSEDGSVNSVYTHKMKILDIVMDTADSEWTYVKNGKPVRKGHTNLTFNGATRSAPTLVEPSSGESWLEEYLAAKTIAVAEHLFTQKRA